MSSPPAPVDRDEAASGERRAVRQRRRKGDILSTPDWPAESAGPTTVARESPVELES